MKTRIGMIASDLTGALDTSTSFVEASGDTIVLLHPSAEGDASTTVIITNTHTVSPAAAYTTVRGAAQRLRGRWLFKKIDSTLRGNIGPEIRATLDETRARAIVCPALPREGRTVERGVGLYKSIPVHLTEYGRHPTAPCRESSLLTILRHSSIDVGHIPLKTVREGVGHLCAALSESHAEAVVIDALTDEDLAVIAGAAAARRENWFACGSSGLAPHLARALGVLNSPQHGENPLARHNVVLTVIGSRNPATVRQVQELNGQAGTAVVTVEARLLCEDTSDALPREAVAVKGLRSGLRVTLTTSLSEMVPQLRHEVAPKLGAVAARVADTGGASALVVSGGHTGWYTCNALGIERLEVVGEVEPGVVCSRDPATPGTRVTIISKAGGFGDSHLLVRLLAKGGRG